MSIEVDIFKSIDIFTDKIFNPKDQNNNDGRGVCCIKDIVYDNSDPNTCTLDFYYVPSKMHKTRPIMFYVHGGGFVAGDKKYRRGVCRWYAEQGMNVFSVNYGLCPQYRYPQPLVHIITAVNHIVKNASKYNVNLNKFLVSGDSAGAYYVAMLMGARNSTELSNTLHARPKVNFSGAVLNCGVYEIKTIMEAKMIFNINKRIFKSFTGQSTADFDSYSLRELCSPTAYINKNYPPCLIIYSEKDLICSGQSERLIAKMQEVGARYVEYKSNALMENHCFPLNRKGKYAEEANKKTVLFIKDIIKNG